MHSIERQSGIVIIYGWQQFEGLKENILILDKSWKKGETSDNILLEKTEEFRENVCTYIRLQCLAIREQ